MVSSNYEARYLTAATPKTLEMKKFKKKLPNLDRGSEICKTFFIQNYKLNTACIHYMPVLCFLIYLRTYFQS
jgi:hypothetical protein